LCCRYLGYDDVFVGLQFVGIYVVGRQEQRITKKEELDIYVEFLRRRDFLKPSGMRVIGQSWPVLQQE